MYKLNKEQIENAPEFMPVVGYEGLYEVGKDGSVWSLDYRRSGERKQLKPILFDKWGYLGISLCKDRKRKPRRVHQLVLEAYLPKPSEDLEVLHLNSKPADNRLDNLAWGTHQENTNDSHRKDLISTPVVCLETGEVYPSVHEAERQTGIVGTHISACCNGRPKRKTAGGYHWAKFVEGDNPLYS